MSAWRALARRWLELPPPRCKVATRCEWLALPDGTRLATRSVRPDGAAARASLLVRSAAAAHDWRHPIGRLAELLAEQGVAVVVQECRGLHASEGVFEPFVNEAADARDTLAWLLGQSWFAPPLYLAGVGYGGYAAYAALSVCPLPVERLVIGSAASDVHAWLYSGGALRLEEALGLAFALGAAEPETSALPALQRALRHRPVRDADRVGLRRLDWLREWLDHPTRDAFWEARCAPLPPRAPHALLLSSWDAASLRALLADASALARLAEQSGSGSLALEIGSGAATTRRAAWRSGREALRSALHFLLPEPASRRPPVRLFDAGSARWRELASWPPRSATRCLHLRGDGRARGADGDGRLDAEPPGALEPPDRFVYDPADATPSGDELAVGGRAQRGDVLCYASAALPAPLWLCGAVRAELHVASDAPATDFCVRLVALDAAGRESELCEGIARLTAESGALEAPRSLTIECGAACFQLAAGSRLRLEIASASHPRFDRAPNTREAPARAGPDTGAPARQTLFHDAARPSRLAFEAGEA